MRAARPCRCPSRGRRGRRIRAGHRPCRPPLPPLRRHRILRCVAGAPTRPPASPPRSGHGLRQVVWFRPPIRWWPSGAPTRPPASSPSVRSWPPAGGVVPAVESAGGRRVLQPDRRRHRLGPVMASGAPRALQQGVGGFEEKLVQVEVRRSLAAEGMRGVAEAAGAVAGLPPSFVQRPCFHRPARRRNGPGSWGSRRGSPKGLATWLTKFDWARKRAL